MAPARPGTGAKALRRCLLLAALVSGGCRMVDVGPPISATSGHGGSHTSPVANACRARREGLAMERKGVDSSVDRYYEATVHASVALAAVAAGPVESGAFEEARDLYNGCLLDCLRAGQRFGRLDPRSSLLVNGPSGTITVPIRHVGFVWKGEDFGRVVDPASAPRNPAAHADEETPGVGAAVAVERTLPRQAGPTEYLPHPAVFNATAVLRPDLDAWLAPPGSGRPPADALEFLDPLRTPDVAFGPAPALPLRSAPNGAIAVARQIQESRGPFALAGFAAPELMLSKADIRMLEPYQPGKSPFLLVHGLVNDPFMFNDMVVALQRTPGFLDRHQIWVFRYPTGVTFIRSAAILREKIEAISDTLDPEGTDPALSDWTVTGFSMGGLLTRLQVASSGDTMWNEVSNRPLDQLQLSDKSRETLRKLFFFEPSPRIRRAIFIATPHDGAAPAIAAASWLTSRIVRRPADTRHLVAEVEERNPGAVKSTLRNLPSSVDALAAYSPILPAMRKLPYAPGVDLHTIAGTGFHDPARGGRGDTVVPLTSAHIDEAASEHHVRARHTTIYYHPDTIAEVRRILGFATP